MSKTEQSMTILGHIDELRKRLLKALIALIITTAISFSIGEKLIILLLYPIGGMQSVQSIEVTENVSVFMRVTLLSGFIFAFPVILYQLMGFILPGLTRTEKKWVILSIPFATLLFISGVMFAYYVMLPTAIPFLVSFLGIQTTPRISNYINFVTSLLFWIGMSFELPLLVFILAKLRIVTAKMLANQWRLAIVIIAIVAAMITPTVDPVNMGLLMAPLMCLYLLSLLMAAIAGKGYHKE